MTMLRERSKPADRVPGRAAPDPLGSWTIDPAHSSVTLTWSRLRLATITGRLHCLGVIHLDELPPVGVIRFEQPSGLPLLTMALDPASIDTHDADLDARLRSPEAFDVQRHRWWTLRSESLEILPSGAWRVVGDAHCQRHPEAGRAALGGRPEGEQPDWLVLGGHGLLDRRAFGIGRPAWTFPPQIRVDLSVRARRVEGPHPHREER